MSAEISIFLGPLQNLLSWFQKERHFKDEKKDAALQAINKAIIATKRYIEESGGERCFDRTKEFELSELWADAATKARYASSELAIRLNDKSAYWTDRFEWSREEVLLKQIDLDSIHHEVNSLLKQV